MAGQPTQYDNTPSGWAQRWKVELDASSKALEKFLREGKEAQERYVDERNTPQSDTPERRWNLFYANVSLTQALLFGQVPKVGVDRTFADANDDAARVASEMLERLLNNDLDTDDPYCLAVEQAFQDRLLPGHGICRVRYEVEWEESDESDTNSEMGMDARSGATTQGRGRASGNGEPMSVGDMADARGAELPPSADGTDEHEALEALPPAQQAPPKKRPGSERAEVEYVNWDDVRWSAGARTWHEVTWVAFKGLMSQQALIARFGETLGKAIPLNAHSNERDKKDGPTSPWDRAEVWEIWDKQTKCVYWYVDGLGYTLGGKDDPGSGRQEDPLRLSGFFPCPRPMAANLTTRRYVPRSDWALAKDLYLQLDQTQTRLGLLIDAVRVAGLYDAQSGDIKRLLSSVNQNELYPVQNWAAFSEKGGVKGAVDWLPLEQIVNSIAALRKEQAEMKAQLYELTGHSDILRGQGEGPGVTYGEQRLKANFASARMRMLQKDLARFASELASLRAEVMCRFFDDASLIVESNMQNHPDARMLNAAIALLRQPEQRAFRVKVLPEDMADSEFAQLQGERQAATESIAGFVAQMGPVAQQVPFLGPLLIRILQWRLSTVRGASELEGMLDQAATAMQNQPPPQPQQQGPDPKVQAQIIKGQQEQQKIQAELQADLIRNQAEVQGDAQREANQRIQNVAETQEKALITARMRAVTGRGGPT
jgi:hypothetical protein